MPEPIGSACQSDDADGNHFRAACEAIKADHGPNDTHGRRENVVSMANVDPGKHPLSPVCFFAYPGNPKTGSRALSHIIAG